MSKMSDVGVGIDCSTCVYDSGGTCLRFDEPMPSVAICTSYTWEGLIDRDELDEEEDE